MTWSFEDFDKKFNKANFDCGVGALNDYLKNQMSQDFTRKANVPVFAVNPSNEVVGYYTLSASSVEFSNFPDRLKKLIAPYPVSVARIGRLAVDQSMQGQGLGKELLMHAIDRAEETSKKLGLRAVVVDAKDASAEAFYLKYGFEYLQNTNQPRKSLFIII